MVNHPSSDQLEALLNEELPDDLQDEVESHLEECTDCMSRLDSLALTLGPLGAMIEGASDRPSFADRQIGPYRLIEEIGEGGMGAVWLAEQTSPVKRQVAIKLIKQGRADKRFLARFDAERQALAMMKHPNIAKVLDAGAAEDGTPYFVMELVEGRPITEHCDHHRLHPVQRLELFTQVCAAVQHAHHKGIIHRDLKPSNVLVEMVMGEPKVKVIDFGLAKSLDHHVKLADETACTEIGQVLGTVRYMSPEQAGVVESDIDTRTDIFSLGVLLYELLTGSTPIQQETLKQQALLKALELVRECDPLRPSKRLSSLDNSVAVCEVRRVAPIAYHNLLRRDLDWIAMKALDKDPNRRYSTPKELSTDIARHLNGDAVEARPPSKRYRFRIFIRKHRGLVATAALVFSLLVAGVAATSVYANREAAARRRADAARVEAQQAAERAANVLKIVNDAFQSITPQSGGDARTPAKSVLQSAKDRLKQSDLDDWGRMIFLDNLRSCFFAFGEYQEAIAVGEEAFRLFQNVRGVEHEDTIAALTNLANAYRFGGDPAKAVQLTEQAYELTKAAYGADHLETMKSMVNLGGAYENSGDISSGVELLQEAVRWANTTLSVDHPMRLTFLGNLGLAYDAAGKYEDALELHTEAVQLSRSTLGEMHPDTLSRQNSLAASQLQLGRLDEAIVLFEQTLKATEAKFGGDHAKTLTVRNNLGSAYRSAGRLEEAIPILEQVVRDNQDHRGPDHKDTLISMNNLAGAYYYLKQLDEATEVLEQVVRIADASLGPTHIDTLVWANNLAGMYCDLKQPKDAVVFYERAVSGLKNELGADHPNVVLVTRNLARTYIDLERVPDARAALEACVDSTAETDDSWSVYAARADLGRLLLKQNEPEAAKPLLETGHQGMTELQHQIPPVVRAIEFRKVVESLIDLAKSEEDSGAQLAWEKELQGWTESEE